MKRHGSFAIVVRSSHSCLKVGRISGLTVQHLIINIYTSTVAISG